MSGIDSLKTRRTLEVQGKKYDYCSLPVAAATIGDIFVMRCLRRGAAGVVTDGGLRDTPAIYAIDLPVYHRSSHAATLQREHLPLEVDGPVACAGVLGVSLRDRQPQAVSGVLRRTA